jgi:hypothetical protein
MTPIDLRPEIDSVYITIIVDGTSPRSDEPPIIILWRNRLKLELVIDFTKFN